MKFDVIKFLQDYNIPFKERAPNLKKGNIGVNCPFHDDIDYYAAFIMDGDNVGFNCWKCGGFSLWNVIQQFTKAYPKNVLEKYGHVPKAKKQISIEKNEVQSIVVPGGELQQCHKDYLTSRNFDSDWLRLKYKLKGTTYDTDYPYRIIIPIIYGGRIVSYTSRDYTNKQKIRYKACSEDLEIIHHKHLLYNLDNCLHRKGIMVEGLFDVFRLGNNSFASFGTSVTNEQLYLIKERFDLVYLLFDNETKAIQKAEHYADMLDSVGVKSILLIDDVPGDPGTYSEEKAMGLKADLGLL